ncbi:hypothetical protein ACJMK2_019769 [Sinanodonta woodiana]|uniref:Uncharacterized protein n=1 Tax=Sinanodonta woodiana TaxID=1069815 RepID=A0ABD3TXB1_SINWO
MVGKGTRPSSYKLQKEMKRPRKKALLCAPMAANPHQLTSSRNGTWMDHNLLKYYNPRGLRHAHQPSDT